MNIFLAPLVAGVLGLAGMALPGLRRHGRGAHLRRSRGPRHAKHSFGRLVPEPRTVLSFCALYGAFGNVLVAGLGCSTLVAGLVALVPAALLEALVVGRLYDLALRFEGRPSTPLDALAAEEARAVSPFKNGRGLVEAVRDGRSIQLVAQLAEDHHSLPVRVGERLRIVSVDADRQRVTVSHF